MTKVMGSREQHLYEITVDALLDNGETIDEAFVKSFVSKVYKLERILGDSEYRNEFAPEVIPNLELAIMDVGVNVLGLTKEQVEKIKNA